MINMWESCLITALGCHSCHDELGRYHGGELVNRPLGFVKITSRRRSDRFEGKTKPSNGEQFRIPNRRIIALSPNRENWKSRESV